MQNTLLIWLLGGRVIIEENRSPLFLIPLQYHAAAAAAQMPRTQPGRERLAIPARQLALKPHLHIPRRHRRSVLPRLEQPRRATIPHLLHRIAPMGTWVKINEDWYYG